MAQEKGEDEQALKIVDFLNSAESSPWFGKIAMANQDSKDTTINQKSFVKAIKKYILTANNPISNRTELQLKIFLNYWSALAELLDINEPTVLYKYFGVDLFSRFSIPFFHKLEGMGKGFKVETMKKVLEETFENIEGDYSAVGHPEWWKTGSAVSNLNASAIGRINQDLTKALNKAKFISDVEV